MQAMRLNEVLTRVVAWHNRHPLARRIGPSQVHSIGEVVLPFASATPVAQAASQALREPRTPPPVLLDEVLDSPAAPPPAEPPPPAAPAYVAPVHDESTASQDSAELFGGGDATLADAPPTEADPLADDAPGEAADDAPAAPTASAAADEAAMPAEPAAAEDTASTEPPADDDPFAAALAAEPPAELSDAPETPAAPDEANAEAAAPQADPEPPGDGPAPGADAPLPATAAADEPDSLAHTEASAPADDDDEPPPPSSAALAAELGPQAPAAPDATDAPESADPGSSAMQADADPDSAHPADDTTPQHPQASRLRQRATATATATASAQAPAPARPAAPPGWWARLLARLRGHAGQALPKLAPAFSRNFIWPLTPARVASWARRHGQLASLASPDWPRRLVDTDYGQLSAARQRGLTHNVPVHVITAAIGVGDRRMRVLIGADGAVIGPRAYSPLRVSLAAGTLGAALLGAAWPALHALMHRGDEAQVVAVAALPASAASDAASAAEAAASAALAASAAEASAAAEAASAALAHAAASGPIAVQAAASAPAGAHAGTAPAAHGGHEAPAAAKAPAEPVPESAVAANAAAEAPSKASRLGRIRPELDDEQKMAAKAQSQAARGRKPGDAASANAPPPVFFALVTAPTREKDFATSGLIMMRKLGTRLPPPIPENAELIRQGNMWRATWWPFTSLADAERARVSLAGRGLKVEIIEL